MVSSADAGADDLSRMLRAVERIANSVDNIRELAVRLAPRTAPGPTMISPDYERAILRTFREAYLNAATASRADVTVPRVMVLGALLKLGAGDDLL